MPRRPFPARALLLALPLLGSPAAGWPQAQPAFAPGPPISFSRRGPEVCASYALDGSRSLYRERIYAFEAGARLPIQGLPAGKDKEVAGERVALLERSFKACARASSASAAAAWVDQSCAPAQGVCLPPRAFEIDAAGSARALPPGQAAALFAKGFAPGAPAAGPGDWTFKLDLKKP